MIEQWLLRSTAIQEKIVKSSGLSRKELIAWDKEETRKALNRLAELNLPEPWTSHPNAIELHRTFGSRAYKVVVSTGVGFKKEARDLIVFCGLSIKSDNKLWYHVSVSTKNRIPTYKELALIKDIFIGEENTAIQVFSASKNHVNDHPNCLHLWRCLEEDVLPEFSMLGTI